MDNPKTLLEHLKDSGMRMTKTRRAVVELLFRSKGPISAQDILSSLKKGSLEVNKTTIYREIDALLAAQVIREVDLLEGKKRYELHLEHDHHHHIICTECKAVQCVEIYHDLDSIEREILKKHRFKVTSHSLEFFGLCSSCR